MAIRQPEYKRLLCTLSGDDWGIIQACSPLRQRVFTAIGGFVLAIFALCFLSSCYTFVQMFHNLWTGVPAGLFFAAMITNIYLLLLYTLSKNVLPHVSTGASRMVSIGLRLLFICFIAIVVSKPLEAYVFSGEVDQEITTYKESRLRYFAELEDTYLAEAVVNLDPAKPDDAKIVLQRRMEHDRAIRRMRELSDNSPYFVRSIALLNVEHPRCWLLTALMIAIFIVPAYLKYIVPESAKFYDLKKQKEVEVIQTEYSRFKQSYTALFRTLHNTRRTFKECFEDAPFNTLRKTDKRVFETQQTLLRKIYDA